MVKCKNCNYYPDDCLYWSDLNNGSKVKPDQEHNCPDFNAFP